MIRPRSISVRLQQEEFEWLKRRAHWDGVSMAEVLRDRLRALIAMDGYLRPPDDEPQDFGFEKEMIEFVNSVERD